MRWHWLQILKIAGLFAIVESITPVLGWAIGTFSKQWIEAWDHWIAFVLLSGIGSKILFDVIQELRNPEADENHEQDDQNDTQNIIVLLITAIGTSIDAMTIGVSFAFLSVNIWLAAVMIGLATLSMTFLGLKLGKKLGTKFGHYAEACGGMVLILIGCSILVQHLHLF